MKTFICTIATLLPALVALLIYAGAVALFLGAFGDKYEEIES